MHWPGLTARDKRCVNIYSLHVFCVCLSCVAVFINHLSAAERLQWQFILFVILACVAVFINLLFILFVILACVAVFINLLFIMFVILACVAVFINLLFIRVVTVHSKLVLGQ